MLECGKFGGGILKHRAKSIAHRVEQRTVLRFRVSGVRGRCQKTDDRGQVEVKWMRKSEVGIFRNRCQIRKIGHEDDVSHLKIKTVKNKRCITQRKEY